MSATHHASGGLHMFGPPAISLGVGPTVSIVQAGIEATPVASEVGLSEPVCGWGWGLAVCT